MLGETIAVLRPSYGEPDEMGQPAVTWSVETVEGALVRPLSGSELNDALRPDGVRVRYAVSLPKGYHGTLGRCRVALVARGMDPADAETAYRVTGPTDETPQSPLAWDRTVEVGRADG